MKASPGRLVSAATLVIFLVWMAFVLASLYVVQKPFTPTTGAALARTFWSALAPIVIFACAGFLGRRILSAAGLQGDSRLEKALFGLAVGSGVLAILIFLLGASGLLGKPLLQALFAAGLLYLLVELGQRRAALATLSRLPRPPWWLALYLVWMAGLTLLVALAPPWGWDSLFYHLVVPKRALESGNWPAAAGVPHFLYPSLMESLFTWVTAAAGDRSAAPLHALFAVGTAGVVYALTRRLMGSRAGWMGVAIWASMPMVFVLGSWAYTDMALAFYLATSVLAMVQWETSRKSRWLMLAGAGVGLALGVKYTAVVGAVALGTYLVWKLLAGKSHWKAAISALIQFALPALLLASPWYLRNAIATGNPIYPFVFGGPGWDGFRAQWYGRPGTGLGWDAIQLLILPWTATVGIRDANYYDGQTGPMFLLLLPALATRMLVPRFRRRLPPQAGVLLWCAGVLATAWAIGVIQSQPLFQTRLLLPCLTITAPIMAFLLEHMDELMPGVVSARRLTTAALLLVMLLNVTAWTTQTAAFDPLPVLVGRETEEAYLRRNLGAHAVAMQELAGLPANSKALFLWEPRTYYSPVPAYPDAILDNWAHAIYQFGSAAQAAGHWRSQGFTHILLYRYGLDFVTRTGLDPLTPYALAELKAFLEKHAERLPGPAEPLYELYALRPAGAEP
ncbi:MAG: ArnT family glycosyltransferase [Anaerolineae bacterium]